MHVKFEGKVFMWVRFSVDHSVSECLRSYLLFSFYILEFFVQDFVCMSQAWAKKKGCALTNYFNDCTSTQPTLNAHVRQEL